MVGWGHHPEGPPTSSPQQALRGFQATPTLTPTLTHKPSHAHVDTPSPADTWAHAHRCPPAPPTHTHPHGPLLPPTGTHSHPHHDPRPTITVTGASCPPLWGLPGNDSACGVSGCGGRGAWRGCGGRSCRPVSGRHPRPPPARLAGCSPWCAQAGGLRPAGIQL